LKLIDHTFQHLNTRAHSHHASSATKGRKLSITSPGSFSPPLYPAHGSASQKQQSKRPKERSFSSSDVRTSNATQPENARTASIENATRRKSASRLLRRSSAYLRQKLQAMTTFGSHTEHWRYNERLSRSQPERIDTVNTTLPQNVKPKKSIETVRSLFNSWRSYRKPQHQHVREIFEFDADLDTPPVPPLPPSKIATNTTISVSQLNASVAQLSRGGKATMTTRLPPPVIKQYPPRPLVYSAVESPPVAQTNRSLRDESTLRALKSRYRQSMPVLPQSGGLESTEKTHRRRRSSDPEIPTTTSTNTNTGNAFEKNARRLSRMMGCNTLVKRASSSFRKRMSRTKKRGSLNDVFAGPEHQQVEILVA
jgi:hypothetical protein